jgi:hypothetical protein
MSTDERIEQLLRLGHPEADAYVAPPLDLTRRPVAAPRRRLPLSTIVAAVLVIAAVAVGSTQIDRSGPAEPTLPAAASATGEQTASPSESPKLVLEIVEDPEGELTSVFMRLGKCGSVLSALIALPDGDELDRQIEESGITQGWLTVGGRWLGNDRVALAEAFGALRVAAAERTSDVVWMLTRKDGFLRATEIRAFETPRGHLVWSPGNKTVSEAPCKEPAPGPLVIPVVEDPREAAMQEMVKRGVSCFTGSDVLRILLPERLDEAIDEKGIDHGWLVTGRSWLGADPAPMVVALGSTWAVLGLREDELWVIHVDSGRLVSDGYNLVETPKGRQVWQATGGSDRATDC